MFTMHNSSPYPSIRSSQHFQDQYFGFCRDAEYVLYGVVEDRLLAFRVKPAVFELVLAAMIAVYLALVYWLVLVSVMSLFDQLNLFLCLECAIVDTIHSSGDDEGKNQLAYGSSSSLLMISHRLLMLLVALFHRRNSM